MAGIQKTICLIGLVCTAITLSACKGGEDESQGKNLLESQQRALEKAKAVEDELQQATEERMGQIDE